MLNTIIHVNNFQDGRKIQNGRQIEYYTFALKMHGLTRKRTLVDTFFILGMCVSYDRLLQMTADMAEGICTRL